MLVTFRLLNPEASSGTRKVNAQLEAEKQSGKLQSRKKYGILKISHCRHALRVNNLMML